MSGAEEGVWDPAEDMSRLFGGQESGEGEPLLQKREAAPEPPATGWRWVAEVFRKVRAANIVFFSVSYRIYTKHFR